MKYTITILAIFALMIVGCTRPIEPVDPIDPVEPVYDAHSWKDIISDDCRNFFDGCNKCQKEPGADVAGCTKMYCEVYQKPECLIEVFGPDSWKTLISKDCQKFNDGCNTCYRSDEYDNVMCTEMACSKYNEPHCLDDDPKYNTDSWKDIIDDDCINYFDGCNMCSRDEGSDLAKCTMMHCEEYKKPECRDEDYGPDSWKDIIDDDCTAFYDGCNHCAREPGSDLAGCTEMYCEEYQKPYCKDNSCVDGSTDCDRVTQECVDNQHCGDPVKCQDGTMKYPLVCDNNICVINPVLVDFDYSIFNVPKTNNGISPHRDSLCHNGECITTYDTIGVICGNYDEQVS